MACTYRGTRLALPCMHLPWLLKALHQRLCSGVAARAQTWQSSAHARLERPAIQAWGAALRSRDRPQQRACRRRTHQTRSILLLVLHVKHRLEGRERQFSDTVHGTGQTNCGQTREGRNSRVRSEERDAAMEGPIWQATPPLQGFTNLFGSLVGSLISEDTAADRQNINCEHILKKRSHDGSGMLDLPAAHAYSHAGVS